MITPRPPEAKQGTPPIVNPSVPPSAAMGWPGNTPNATGHRRHQPGMMPFLSLFLLLLAFFLMINSLSRLEVTRTQAILGSLSSTFRSSESSGVERKLGSASGPFIGAEQLEESVTDLLRTAAGVDVFEVFRAGNTLTVLLPVEELFEAETADVTGAVDTLAGLLADSIASEPPGIVFDVTVLMHPDAEDGLALASIRGATLGIALLRRGVVRERLSVGIGDSDPGQVQILMRVLSIEALRSGIALRGDGG